MPKIPSQDEWFNLLEETSGKGLSQDRPGGLGGKGGQGRLLTVGSSPPPHCLLSVPPQRC